MVTHIKFTFKEEEKMINKSTSGFPKNLQRENWPLEVKHNTENEALFKRNGSRKKSD